ncbi:MAG: hypothetical protein IVW55_16360 [Chloroflexi bacterium]|nr:hypothetical protein [Chloroflexota bacterium]
MANEIVATPVLVLTGPVGVGKSAVACELSNLLIEMRVAHAVVDMDWLRSSYPRPEDDPFHTALGLRNLAATWANYSSAGAERLVVVDVVETRAARAMYEAPIPHADVMVVRLNATLPTILSRLEGRETGASLAWHQHRAAELARQMEAESVEDLLVETEGRTIVNVAREVLALVGWAHNS